MADYGRLGRAMAVYDVLSYASLSLDRLIQSRPGWVISRQCRLDYDWKYDARIF